MTQLHPIEPAGSSASAFLTQFKVLDPYSSSSPPFDGIVLALTMSSPAIMSFCKLCSEIDFNSLFSASYDFSTNRSGVFIRMVDHIADSEARENCALCRFMWEMRIDNARLKIEDSANEEKYCLRAFSALDYFCATYDGPKVPHQAKYLSQLSTHIAMAIVPTGFPDKLPRYPQLPESATWSELYNCRFILQGIPNPTSTEGFFGQRLSEQKVDYGAIDEWLSFCDKHHEGTCQGSSKYRPKGFSVIDCRGKGAKIYRPKPQESIRYLTLSYVWGTAAAEPATNDVLPEQLPLVIKDAISVTKELKFGFLWIDRYCIDQNNAEEKHIQIQNMHSIYADSVFTIIAGAANDPSFGLPGVSCRARKRQPSIDLGVCTLVSAPRKHRVHWSIWYTRAWTYQEGLLSRRRLVFDPDQVYFQCGGMQCAEGIALPLISLHKRRKDSFLEDFQAFRFFPPRGVGKYAGDYWKRVSEYRQRSLSFQSDALNAFLGIIGSFEAFAPPVRHLWGLPLLGPEVFTPPKRSKSAIFCHSLTWVSHDYGPIAYTRRTCFPSWSWVGWDTMANYHYLSTNPIDSILSGSKIKDEYNCDTEIKIYTQHSDEIQLDKLSGWPAEILSAASATLLIEARILKIRLGMEEDKFVPKHRILHPRSHSKVHLDKNPSDDALFREKLQGEGEFLAVVLCFVERTYSGTQTKLLIVEFNQEKAAYERIGIAKLDFVGGIDVICPGRQTLRLV